jgi:hypothetical protein
MTGPTTRPIPRPKDDFARFGDFKALERPFPDLEDVATDVDFCDCELGHNGLGMAIRKCDCPERKRP